GDGDAARSIGRSGRGAHRGTDTGSTLEGAVVRGATLWGSLAGVPYGSGRLAIQPWWGGPLGPRGTPSSRSRNAGVSILHGASRPTGASAADPGVRPTRSYHSAIFVGLLAILICPALMAAPGTLKVRVKSATIEMALEQYVAAVLAG